MHRRLTTSSPRPPRLPSFLALVLPIALGLAEAVTAQEPTIRVGAEIPLPAGANPVVELDISADPTRAGRLVVAGIPVGGAGSVAWTRPDGDAGWVRVNFPEQELTGGSDPRVVHLSDGSALFVALSRRPGIGRTRSDVHVIRSTDGGVRWREAHVLAEQSYDYPLVVEDAAVAGRVHLVARVPPDGAVITRRSEDSGRSFGEGRVVASSSTVPILLADIAPRPGGGFVLPYLESFGDSTRVRVASSGDRTGAGGAHPLLATFRSRSPDGAGQESGGWVGRPRIATASDPTAGRVWVVLAGSTPGGARIVLHRSDDGGESWGPAEPLAAPDDVAVVHLMAIVAPDGTLGVSWVERETDASGRPVQSTWFTAVGDGPLPVEARRISRWAGPVDGPGNRRPFGSVLRVSPERSLLTWTSVQGRFPTGGDYLGLTVDADGTFYPVWADARTGRFVPMTVPVRVSGSEAPGEWMSADTLSGVVPVVHDVVPGPTGVTVWILVANRSSSPVGGDLEVSAAWADGSVSVGFGDALGDDRTLDPGETSGPVALDLPLGLEELAELRPLTLIVTGSRAAG